MPKVEHRLTCKRCGIPFTRAYYSSEKPASWCSRKCLSRDRSDKLRGTGNRVYVSRYGQREHRTVMEDKLGRKLLPGELVHHEDDDTHNNDPSNLSVTSRQEHARIHHMGKRHNAILTVSEVLKIRALYATNQYYYWEIAEVFGVSLITIGDIIRGKRWKDVK